ncbi:MULTISPECIES: hypothetical protein [unclassified Polaromonas]|jgi:hypothetical protein|uniref:hypothetical protein n=1 Tax=unclassified Polaromonas TaxID=2638319 RepID=UPI000BDA7A91|nr:MULTISPECIES: hypothetical protein [unclassified Polaromonas]OYZ76091.1 MAG: hypothetical protein B7Y09_21940 [Polaromonas sp. 24-63-21]
MGTENMLLHVDVIVADGKPLAFEDGTGILSGAARVKNETVLSASGDDFTKRGRVATMFKMKLQFGQNDVPTNFSKMQGVQITARDSQSGKRVLMPKCTFAELGDIGGGSVDVSFNVLAEPQWL